MNIGVLGSGMVGQTLAAGVAGLGHDVVIGTRDVATLLARTEGGYDGSPAFSVWHEQHPEVRLGTFADAALHAEILFNATNGAGSLSALEMAGSENLDGKILIDVSNPLDFSQGMPPSLFVSNTDSLGETIQRTLPGARVVKTLNTVTASIMVNPSLIGDGDHDVFVSGNDQAAKAEVTRILQEWFGWKNVVDLGDITTSRGPEMYLPLWLRVLTALGKPMINLKIVR